MALCFLVMACTDIVHGQAFKAGMRCRAGHAGLGMAIQELEWLLGASRACLDAGSYEESADMAASARELAMRMDDTAGLAEAKLLAGLIEMSRREYEGAGTLLAEARDLGRKLGCKRLVLHADIHLAGLAGRQDGAAWVQDSLSRAVRRAIQLDDGRGEALAYYYAGLQHQALGDPAGAQAELNRAVGLARKHGDVWLIAAATGSLGVLYGSSGQYAEAIPLFREALERWVELNNLTGMADSEHRLGNVGFYLGDYQGALSHYLNALNIRKEVGPPLKVGESFHDIGHIYFKQEHFADALEHYEAALVRFQSAGNKQRIGQAYGSMGNVFSRMGDTEGALDAYETSINILEGIGDKSILVYSLNNAGQLYVERGDFSRAREHLQAAKVIALQLEDLESLSLCYYNLAAASAGQYRWGAARALLDTSLDVSGQTGSKDLLMWGHYLSARVDSALGKPASALEHYKQYKLYADSLQGAERDCLHADMKARYESERKEEELRRLEAEHALQQAKLRRQTTTKNLLLAVLALGGLLGFFVYRYYVTRQRLRIQVLRNRIAADLHDEVGSTLSSIAIFSEIAQQRSGEVKPMMQTINESSRKMLEAMTDIVWTIDPDNDQFEQIILRMRNYAYELLGAKGIGFDFSADDDTADIRLPMDLRRNLFLIFKEATNNMLKYADADMVVFRLSTRHGGLSMVIRDNGKGFDPEAATAGNGLRNMRRRAEEVGGTLVIESAPGQGTTVQLSIARY